MSKTIRFVNLYGSKYLRYHVAKDLKYLGYKYLSQSNYSVSGEKNYIVFNEFTKTYYYSTHFFTPHPDMGSSTSAGYVRMMVVANEQGRDSKGNTLTIDGKTIKLSDQTVKALKEVLK